MTLKIENLFIYLMKDGDLLINKTEKCFILNVRLYEAKFI